MSAKVLKWFELLEGKEANRKLDEMDEKAGGWRQ